MDNDLECLRPFLVRHEDPAQDVIQVDGIRVAGVPLGSPEFVTRYVESKRDDILHDLPKLDVVSDDLVHAHMMTYCQHPRFGFLGRNLPPAALAAQAPDAVSPLTEVHQAILKALLNRGTANAFQEWQDDVQQYCAHVLERPPHKGGHGITKGFEVRGERGRRVCRTSCVCVCGLMLSSVCFAYFAYFAYFACRPNSVAERGTHTQR